MAVNDIILSQQGKATDAITQANSFLDTLTALSEISFDDITAPVIWNYTIFDNSEEAIDDVRNSKPASPDIEDLSLTLPNEPSFSIDDIDSVEIPEFSGIAPILSFPDRPDATLPTVPSEPEIFDTPIPGKPIITLPTVPVLSTVSIPDPPVFNLPTFSEDLPDDFDNLTEPTNEFTFNEEDYSEDTLTELRTLLLSDLQDGSYGINVDDEAALWNRARERELRTMLSAEEELLRNHSQFGFDVPQGSFMNAQHRLRTETSNKVSSINRDIAIKRSDNYVQARQFAVTSSIQLNQILINYHNSVMERALNYARITVEIAIKVFDAKVRLAMGKLDKYRIASDVYRSLIEAELAKLQIYKTQVDAAKVEADLQQIQVDIYRTQLEGVNMLIEIYKTEMQAATLFSEIQEKKLNVYRERVNAYVAQVRGKVAEFDMYKAGIQGETARVEAYSAEVNAYGKLVDAKATESRVRIQESQHEMAIQELDLRKFTTIVDARRAELLANTEQYKALISKYGADIGAYNAEIRGIADLMNLNVGVSEANARTSIEASRITIDKARLELQKMQQEAQLRLGAANAGANIYGDLVSGALNSINTLAAQVEMSEST